MTNWRENIYFTLVEPKEPGNVGAAARAVKNMDFRHLCLVNSPPITEDETAKFAHNSHDILISSEIHETVRSAVSDKHYVVGTTRRRGQRRGVFLPVDEGVRHIREIAETQRVAILFGREDRGLFNDEMEECGFIMTVPANSEQPSINLGQAVMVFAYELSKTDWACNEGASRTLNESLLKATPPRMPKHGDLVRLYDRLENVLKLIEYIPPDDKYLRSRIMLNLKHCLGRAGLTEWEFNMFHGICKQIEKKLGQYNIDRRRGKRTA